MSVPDTLVVLSTPSGFPLYSARGITQTLAPIAQTQQLVRTVNGALHDVSLAAFRKYTSTLTCTDMRSPKLDGIWPGQQLTIDCVSELSFPTIGGSAAKTIVPGSERVEGAFTFYRPRLTMRVVNYSTETDEWNAQVNWSLELEEV